VLVVGAGVLWSIGSYAATRLELPTDPLLTTVVQMLGGSVSLAAAGLLRGESPTPAEVSGTSVLALAYLVVFGSLVAFTATAGCSVSRRCRRSPPTRT
jgi:drug/metabolite transporter (DMT)-like permease